MRQLCAVLREHGIGSPQELRAKLHRAALAEQDLPASRVDNNLPPLDVKMPCPVW